MRAGTVNDNYLIATNRHSSAASNSSVQVSPAAASPGKLKSRTLIADTGSNDYHELGSPVRVAISAETIAKAQCRWILSRCVHSSPECDQR